MTDMTPMSDPVAAPTDEQASAQKSGGFLSTTTGKLVIGGVALIAVLVLLGVVAFVFFTFFASPPSTTTTTAVTTTKVVKSGSATATVAPTNPPEPPLSSTFTFRNIFAPTVKNPGANGTSSSSSSSSSTSSTAAVPSLPADTLLLESVQTVDGVKQATFVWNGQRYTVTAGQQVDGSPWKVLSIGSSSCVMLYGDQRVTLSVGQAAGK